MLISVKDLIKKSYELYAKNAKLFFTYAIIVSAPSVILSTLVSILRSVFNLQKVTMLTPLYAIMFAIFGVISYFLSLWFSIGFIKAVSDKYNGKSIENIKKIIGNTRQFILPTLIVSILTALAVLGGLILLIVPGIIFSVWFAFSFYVVVLDGKDGTEAMRESKKLVEGRWLEVFIKLFVPSLLFLIISGILQSPFSFMLTNTKSVFMGNMINILSSVVSIMLAPFLVASQAILYNELKKTKKA